MNIETISIIVGVTSFASTIILGVLALWITINFYQKAKDSEQNTSIQLNSIRNETQNLKIINETILKDLIGTVSGVVEKQTTAMNQIATGHRSIPPGTGTANLPEPDKYISTKSENKKPSHNGEEVKNSITGHNIDDYADPFTINNLKHEYVANLVIFFNMIAWINNYSQSALIEYSKSNNSTPHDSIHSEIISNINQSYSTYHSAEDKIKSIISIDPDFYGNISARNLYKSTKIRHDNFIRDYNTVLRFFCIGQNLEPYNWPDRDEFVKKSESFNNQSDQPSPPTT